MRVLIVFLVLCVQLWSNEIENTLKNLSLTPQRQEMLKSAMAEFYAEKRAYQQNGYRIRNRLLLDLKNGTKVDLEQYKQAFQEVSEEYIKARIAFYCAVAEILDAENMEKLLESLE
ncbi:hypothetical protein [Helicobacter sp.]|uniref:hypothetical protein n=1 Tax=Helicobacter sp. TaxID=218 RepID=UPI00199F2B6B|nr:hypothetical protein [Helicobacter sp.]MBD5164515.1 hypothetical protein [Helicobacter sp.]